MDGAVKALEGDLIEAYLKGKGWKYTKQDDEQFHIVGSYGEQCGRDLTFRFLIEGANKDLYVIRTIAHTPIPKDEWGRAMVLCNDWNNDKRWPRAYLQRSDYATDTENYVILDGHFDLGNGIHPDLLGALSDWVITGSIDFWEWAYKKRGW